MWGYLDRVSYVVISGDDLVVEITSELSTTSAVWRDIKAALKTKSPSTTSLHKPWGGYDCLESMVLQCTEAMTFPKPRGHPRVSSGKELPPWASTSYAVNRFWSCTGGCHGTLPRLSEECSENQLLLLKTGRKESKGATSVWGLGGRRRPSPGIKKQVLHCQGRKWEGGAGWIPTSRSSSPDISYDAQKWGHILLIVILNTAVTTVPYDIFQIQFIKLSCK